MEALDAFLDFLLSLAVRARIGWWRGSIRRVVASLAAAPSLTPRQRELIPVSAFVRKIHASSFRCIPRDSQLSRAACVG
jgi:hypothetical protein